MAIVEKTIEQNGHVHVHLCTKCQRRSHMHIAHACNIQWKASAMWLWLANGLVFLVLHCYCNFRFYSRGLAMCALHICTHHPCRVNRKALTPIVTYLLIRTHACARAHTPTEPSIHTFSHPMWLLRLTMIYKHGHVISAVKCQYCWSHGISHFSYRYKKYTSWIDENLIERVY